VYKSLTFLRGMGWGCVTHYINRKGEDWLLLQELRCSLPLLASGVLLHQHHVRYFDCQQAWDRVVLCTTATCVCCVLVPLRACWKAPAHTESAFVTGTKLPVLLQQHGMLGLGCCAQRASRMAAGSQTHYHRA
jgi:hypothetical protein